MNIKTGEKNLLFFPLLSVTDIGQNAKYLEFFVDGKFAEIIRTFINECFPRNSASVTEDSETNFIQFVRSSIKTYVFTRSEGFDVLLAVASCLFEFIQCNFLGPPGVEKEDELLQYLLTASGLSEMSDIGRAKEDIVDILSSFDDIIPCSTKQLVLLFLAKNILTSIPVSLSQQWWLMRSLYIHQLVLHDPSPCIHEQLIETMKHLQDALIAINDNDLLVMFYLEKIQIHLQLYSEITEVKDLKIHEMLHLKEVKLDGRLGKRTRFQQRDIAQLTLSVEKKENVVEELQSLSSAFTNCNYRSLYFPKDQRLDDEVRLPQIKFADDTDGQSSLNVIQQAAILASYMFTKKSEPKDEILVEKLLAYLSYLLHDPQSWNIQSTALLQRSLIETDHSRTVERSITQIQSLLTGWEAATPDVLERLPLVFCSFVVPKQELETNLARLLVQVGAIQSALDIYKHLQMWEEIVACYNHLKLRHKAAEVIRNEMGKRETVQLWCLLGDATDDETCYEKAWQMSDCRSSKAQKHWGLYYFHRKEYEDSIPHLEKSLEINSLQAPLWFNLGYAALVQKNWKLSAKAYQRYCSLEPDCFEAWNNLAKGYVKLGQKNRAWVALQEATKCNYDSWKVWDNLMAVSTDCGEFQEVIRCYHRILDIKGKHADVEVLDILVNSFKSKNLQGDMQPLKTKALQLFGRITSMVTTDSNVWKLYALLVETGVEEVNNQEKIVHCLTMAQRVAVQEPGWENTIEKCKHVISLSLDLSRAQKTCASLVPDNRKTQHLQSAKLMLKGVISKTRQAHTDALGNMAEELVTDIRRVDDEISHLQNKLTECYSSES